MSKKPILYNDVVENTARTWNVPRLSSEPGSPLDSKWDAIPRLPIDVFHDSSSVFRPVVHAQIGHTGHRIHLRFVIHDQWLLSNNTENNGPVWKDSCVEFFFEPVKNQGYFNLEVNAGGAVLCSYIKRYDGSNGGVIEREYFSEEEIAEMEIATTVPIRIEREITKPIDWAMSAHLPVSLFARRLGCSLPIPGQWRGNFYKCAEICSRPHWASWAPINDELSFHAPERFGVLVMM
jgi:hypothetical protein